MPVSKAHILAEIRRTAEGNGGQALGRARFASATGIREADWTGRYWARWNDALAEAGFAPNRLNERFDDDAVFALLVPEIRAAGRMPTMAELRLRRRVGDGFPSAGVFGKFGTRAALAAKVAEYCRTHPDSADIVALSEPLLSGDGRPTPTRGRSPDDGYVYLLRSGRHYKLGRTNAFGRRERELAIQLPERADQVHVIRTDDPVGIEAYWHRRFVDRRGNGEWFRL
ncbi:MAG: GIY-YIG nuclease family protein, partial [Candidatus Limnocylindria bacterium]